MLADFQQALADVTASPATVIRAREDPSFLAARYQLTNRELDRLVGIIRHPGMQAACMLYRANRLAPLVMYMQDTCRALGSTLRQMLDEFWAAYPETDVHFFVEADRFRAFLEAKTAAGEPLPPAVVRPLRREGAVVGAALLGSHTEDPDMAWYAALRAAGSPSTPQPVFQAAPMVGAD
jgi:hypothetical protein